VQRELSPGQALVLQRLAHHAGRAHRQAVVGEARGARLRQLSHLGQALALLTHGDGGQEPRRYARLCAGALAQRAQHRCRVDHRLGVGLGEDGAEAAGRGGPRSGVDVLLVLAPGRAQVYVRVDEGREGVQSLGLHHLGALRRLERLADRCDRAVAHEQVGHGVDAGARVEHVRAAHQHGRGGRPGEIEPDRGPRVIGFGRVHAGWGSVAASTRAPAGAPRPASSS
jgi:hypothetical protein